MAIPVSRVPVPSIQNKLGNVQLCMEHIPTSIEGFRDRFALCGCACMAVSIGVNPVAWAGFGRMI
jgi:hypothetical protein